MEHREIADAVAGRMRDAWGNATAYAACFTEDGDLLNRFGEVFHGRPAIEAQMRRFFATPAGRSAQSMEVIHSRFVTPDVVLMHVESRVVFPPDGPVPEAHNRQTMILRSEGDTWKVTAFQNTSVTPVPGPPR